MQVKNLLAHYADDIEGLSAPYHRVPAEPAAGIDAFLVGKLDQQAMAAAVAPKLYRQARI